MPDGEDVVGAAQRSERWVIADELKDVILRHHREAVVAIGVHGSLARGDDRMTSDIDFVVVTAPDRAEVIKSRVLRYRGVTVDLGAVDEPDYLAEASALARNWPLAAEQYLVHHALYDPTGHFARLRAAHQRLIRETPSAEFVIASTPHVLGALDHSAKATQRCAADDLPDAWRHATAAALAAAVALGFLERRYYRNATHAIASVLEGPPASFRSELHAAATQLDVRVSVQHLERGVAGLCDYARVQGAQLDTANLDDFARS